MANGGGKIWNEVSITDVRTVLQSSENRLNYLCRLGSINKWARCKPINYDKTGHLTDQQRRGMQSDINNGWYYGIKFSTPNFGLWHNINTTTTDLFATKGLEWGYPARLGDFQGYDHNATADIGVATMASSITQNGQLQITINIAPNGSGVPYSDVVKTNYGTTGTVKAWAFAIITRPSVNASSAMLLDGNPVDLDTTATKTYYVPITSPADNYIISVFLYAPHSQSVGDFTVGEWKDVTSYAGSRNALVLPNGYKHSLKVNPIGNIPIVTAMSVNATTLAVGVTAELNSNVSGDFRMRASGDINGYDVDRTATSTTIFFAWVDFAGRDFMPSPNQPVSVNLTFRCSVDGGNSWGSPAQFSASTVITG